MIDVDYGTRQMVKGLIFTAVYSRHMPVYTTFGETLPEVIGRVRGGVGVLRRVFKSQAPLEVDAPEPHHTV